MTLCNNVETSSTHGHFQFVRFNAVLVKLCAVCFTEKELNTKCVVEMVKNQTILNPAGSNLGKGDSRYVCVFCLHNNSITHHTHLTSHPTIQ